jgi:hypothetical protein
MFYLCSDMTSPLSPSVQLAEMRDCAYRLGMALGAAAEAETDWRRKLELIGLFDRSFFSVRVAIGLELRLARPARSGLADTEREEADERSEPLETEAAERPEAWTERDRDRESERASLPLLLATLRGVAADAAALPGPEPAELPALRDLLARVEDRPAPLPAPNAPGGGARAVPLRTRLAGSSTLALAVRPSPPSAPTLPLRRATGPPRR